MSSGGATALLMVRVIVSLGIVVGLCWVGLWALKRRGTGPLSLGSSSRLDVIDRKPLTREASVAVVRFDGQDYLVGVTEHGVELLDRPAPAIGHDEDDDAAVDLTAALVQSAIPQGTRSPAQLTIGTRRTGLPTTSADADSPARMGFVEALRELTVRRS